MVPPCPHPTLPSKEVMSRRLPWQYVPQALLGGLLTSGLVLGCGASDGGWETPPPSLTADLDGDGYQASDDCNDIDPESHPGALEHCDGQDNDCNGLVDEGLDIDNDQDGFSGCAAIPAETDCNDTNLQDHPTATETCDGVDNNCDGLVDEGFDLDADGVSTCGMPPDCNDADATVSPILPETCNSIDDNCDGQLDETLPGDTHEPNENSETASNLGVLADLPISVTGSLSTLTDQDWFAVTLGGSLEKYGLLQVNLDNVPENSEYTVSVYPVGSDSVLGTAVAQSGAPVELELELESLDAYSATVLIQISWKAGAYGCPPYTLSLQLASLDSAQ